MSAIEPSQELSRLRAELSCAQAHALETEAELARVRAVNADLQARNAHLELMNEKMRRDKYGASSERRRVLDQFEIAFEEAEADASAAEITHLLCQNFGDLP